MKHANELEGRNKMKDIDENLENLAKELNLINELLVFKASPLHFNKLQFMKIVEKKLESIKWVCENCLTHKDHGVQALAETILEIINKE